MTDLKFKGQLIIGDESYFEQLNTNPNVRNLIFNGELDSNLEYEVLSVTEDGYGMILAKLHFYKHNKNMQFDLVNGELEYVKGLEINDKRLRCDTASFKIITDQKEITISTLSDGHYGDVIESSEGEIIITLYVCEDAISESELKSKIEDVLGV